jgi:hypothetical protein
MRFASIICVTLSIVGCSDSTQRSPTVPTPPAQPSPPQPPPQPSPHPSNRVTLWGIVVDPSGVCIEGATVEVIAGPVLVGQKAMQTLPCNLVVGTGGFWFEEGGLGWNYRRAAHCVELSIQRCADDIEEPRRIWRAGAAPDVELPTMPDPTRWTARDGVRRCGPSSTRAGCGCGSTLRLVKVSTMEIGGESGHPSGSDTRAAGRCRRARTILRDGSRRCSSGRNGGRRIEA